MLTLIACPKPFKGHDAVIQWNALESWRRLRPEVQIVLVGDDEGVAEAAAEAGVTHVPQVERNEYGTPLVRGVFNAGSGVAVHDTLCYVNADIILMADFAGAVRLVRELAPYSLLVGRRWDLDITQRLGFEEDWEAALRHHVRRQGSLHYHTGLDYFVFPRLAFGAIPPLALGRVYWDNWLLYRARSRKIPVIDITRSAMVVHQNHGYAHMPGADGRPLDRTPEAVQNLGIIGGRGMGGGCRDADYRLVGGTLRRNISLYPVYRVLQRTISGVRRQEHRPASS